MVQAEWLRQSLRMPCRIPVAVDGNHFRGGLLTRVGYGEIVGAPGWLHGVKDGRAGVHMPADPQPGDPSFAQGWAPSVPWTDRAEVRENGVITTVPTGTYEDVLVLDEWNAEEPEARQQKFYARGVGNIKVGFSGDDETQEELELMSVEQLSADELAEARVQALRLEASANKHCKDVFGLSKPSTPIATGKEGS